MTSLHLRACTAFFLMLAATSLVSCTSSTVKGTQFYVLNALESETNLVKEGEQKEALSLEIVSLQLPQYLERPQIVTRTGSNQLQILEYHQWGGNLRKDMARVLAQNLAHLLKTPNIATAPFRPSTPSDFLLELEVMEFERGSDGKIHLSAQWRLSRGKDRKQVEAQITNLISQPIAESKEMGQTVSTMNVVFGDLCRLIAQSVLKNSQKER